MQALRGSPCATVPRKPRGGRRARALEHAHASIACPPWRSLSCALHEDLVAQVTWLLHAPKRYGTAAAVRPLLARQVAFDSPRCQRARRGCYEEVVPTVPALNREWVG